MLEKVKFGLQVLEGKSQEGSVVYVSHRSMDKTTNNSEPNCESLLSCRPSLAMTRRESRLVTQAREAVTPPGLDVRTTSGPEPERASLCFISA